MLTSYSIAREAILVASQQGMTDGDYAFVIVKKDVDEVSTKMEKPFKWFVSHWKSTLNATEEVKKAFESVLILAPKLPTPSFQDFVDRLRKTMAGPPFYSKAYRGKINGTNMDKARSKVSIVLQILYLAGLIQDGVLFRGRAG